MRGTPAPLQIRARAPRSWRSNERTSEHIRRGQPNRLCHFDDWRVDRHGERLDALVVAQRDAELLKPHAPAALRIGLTEGEPRDLPAGNLEIGDDDRPSRLFDPDMTPRREIERRPRIEKVIAARAETLGISYKEMEKQYLDKVSLRRMVTAQDVANTVAFLCSHLGGNISGQAIGVCGNVEAL